VTPCPTRPNLWTVRCSGSAAKAAPSPASAKTWAWGAPSTPSGPSREPFAVYRRRNGNESATKRQHVWIAWPNESAPIPSRPTVTERASSKRSTGCEARSSRRVDLPDATSGPLIRSRLGSGSVRLLAQTVRPRGDPAALDLSARGRLKPVRLIGRHQGRISPNRDSADSQLPAAAVVSSSWPASLSASGSTETASTLSWAAGSTSISSTWSTAASADLAA
jgi:hypothetical protein